MFKINDRVRLKNDNKENPSLTVRSEVHGQRFLCISDCGQRMVWATTHELELVESNFDLKQAIREVLLSEQFLMEFAKAFASASVPSTGQSWSPITGSASEAYCLQKMERERQAEQSKPSGEVKPPDGWRWLRMGEVIRKGDRCFTNNSGSIDCLTSVGEKFNREAHYPIIRRNRFEVGEKVIDFCGQVWEVEYISDTGNRYRLKHKEVRDEGYGNSLAPYIEETE